MTFGRQLAEQCNNNGSMRHIEALLLSDRPRPIGAGEVQAFDCVWAPALRESIEVRVNINAFTTFVACNQHNENEHTQV